VKYRSLLRLARFAVLSVSGLCVSCVPLSLQYYVPSAEGAKVVSYSCTGNPPYEASFVDGAVPRKYSMRIGLSQQSLAGVKEATITLMIDPFHRTLVDVDPTLIRVEADGESVPIKSVFYYLGKYGGAPTVKWYGPINVETDYLIIHIPLGVRGGTSNIEVHTSPIFLDKERVQLPDVSFKLERHTIMYSLAINC
jgi:hypothetical protein